MPDILDDVIIFSQNFDDHLRRMEEVFDRLREAGLKLKPQKCRFLQKEVTYLGHVVSENGVSTDPSKVSKILDQQFSSYCTTVHRVVIWVLPKLYIKSETDSTGMGCVMMWKFSANLARCVVPEIIHNVNLEHLLYLVRSVSPVKD